MQEGLPEPQKNLHSIGEASRLLNVSIDTIRRWDRTGKIGIIRTPGGTRLVPKEEIERIKQNKPQETLSVGQAAEEFGVSPHTLRRWDQQGLVKASRSPGGNRQYSQSQIQAVKTTKGERLMSLPKPITEIRERLSEKEPEVNQSPSITNQLIPAWFEDYQLKKSTRVSETARPSVPDARYQKAAHYIKYIRPDWYRRYHQSAIHRPLHTVILGLFLLLSANIMFGNMIEKVIQTQRSDKQEIGELLAATTPPRVLSFQGRLTDSSDVPVISATTIEFRIYTSTSGDTGDPCTSTCLWESKQWSVTPDQNGIFSVLLGDISQGDTIIPATLFSENDPLYLAVKAGSDSEMTPRQNIASSAYALNSDALEGFHGSQTPVANEVPILDSSGNLNFGGAASITTTSGNLTLNSAGTLVISDVIDANGPDGSDFAGSVTFNDDVNIVISSSENLDITSTSTGSSGAVSITSTSATTFSEALNLKYTGTSTSGVDQYGMYSDVTNAPTSSWNIVHGNYIKLTDSSNSTGFEAAGNANYGYNANLTVTGDSAFYKTAVGIETTVTNTNSTDQGTRLTYGGSFSTTGDANGNSTAYGIYATASGADTNWAGYFGGNVYSSGVLYLEANGTDGNGLIVSTGNIAAWIVDNNDNQSNEGFKVIRDNLFGTVITNLTATTAEVTISSEDNERLCHSGSDGTTVQLVFIRDCLTSGEDFAEYYGTTGTEKAGDLVSISKESKIVNDKAYGILVKSFVKKSTTPFDNQIIGVISTNPYSEILGEKTFSKKDNPKPVALAGRVPLKVSLEGGPVQIGDPLTSSSTPGVAMKATKPGYVIGKALSGFAGEGIGTVIVFVNVHYSIPESQNLFDNAQLLDELLESINLDEENNLVATISANTKFIWQSATRNIVGWVNEKGEAFFESIEVALANIGILTIKDEIKVAEDAQITGQATFEPGDYEVEIESDKISDDSLIYITPITKTQGFTLYLKEVKDSEGFTVALDKASEGALEKSLANPNSATPSASQAIRFNWLLINQESSDSF